MTNYLFVYGTLKRAFSNEYARFLGSNAAYIGEASVRGRLYLLEGYPGLVLAEGGYDVYGEVFEVTRNHLEVFEMLDHYEGISQGLYHLKEVDLKVNNKTLRARLYQTNHISDVELLGGVFRAASDTP